YDLLLLLSHLREQRSTAYKTMQSVRKAPNEVKTSRNDYDELNEYGQELYREATARKNIIEQILIDRMGYYPKRIDNKLLNILEQKIINQKIKGVIINMFKKTYKNSYLGLTIFCLFIISIIYLFNLPNILYTIIIIGFI